MRELTPLDKPISATIAIPGSKSYTNRALLLGAMTRNPVRLTNCLISDDTKAMIDALRVLGIDIKENDTTITVNGSFTDIQNKDFLIDCNLSGLTMRFLTAFCCVITGTKTLTGKEGLLKRPIGELVEGLGQLGADIEYLDQEGFPPLSISSTKLTKQTATLSGDISSQYFSAMMMIAPLTDGLIIKVRGNQISKPYIDMTIDTMQQFGVHVENKNYQEYAIESGQNYKSDSYIVEGDYSSAGYFFAIAALTKSTLTLTNLNPKSKQADRRLLDVLESMGNVIEKGKNSITIRGTGVKPVTADMEDFPDQAQTLAVLCAFAGGISTLTGIRSLRVKETERAQALVNELGKMEIKVDQTEDSLIIHGGDPKPATIDTYGDHRMAMSFAVAGTKLSEMKINNPEVVSKTFPEFWEKLESARVKIL